MKRLFSILLAAALCAGLLGGCGQIAASDKPGGEFNVTDMMGRSVALHATPQRIVVLLASDVEILYELGAGDLIVGVGEY